MTPVFWRYTSEGDSTNAKKYKVSPKRRREAKTAKAKIPERVREMGYDPDIWTFEELDNWGSDLDDDIWDEIRHDPVVSELFVKAKIKWGKGIPKTFHSPPVKRGTYAFPEGMPEFFLVCWKDYKRLRKHEIRWSKPDLWCHFRDEALVLGVPILEVSGSWVRVHTRDYKKLLRKAIKNDIKEHFEDLPGIHYTIPHRSLGRYLSLDRYEVFLP